VYRDIVPRVVAAPPDAVLVEARATARSTTCASKSQFGIGVVCASADERCAFSAARRIDDVPT
jgi:hypothetical protein